MSRAFRPSAEAAARLWNTLEAARGDTEAAMHERALAVPVLAALAARTDKAVARAQREHAFAEQRRALLEGTWDEYEAHFAQVGRLYAELGVTFDDWYAIVSGLRGPLVRRILETGGPLRDEDLDVANGFVDWVLGRVSSAYLAEKEAILRRAETQLQIYGDVVRHATVGIVVFHLEIPSDPRSLRLVAINETTARVNPPLVSAIGRTLPEVDPEIAASPLASRWVHVIEGGEPDNWTHTLGGSLFDVRAYALPGAHLCLMFTDVTERHRLEERVHRQLAELARSNRDLDDFAYVTSHDLRAPLQDVRNLAQWIQEDAGDLLPVDSQRHLTLLSDRILRMERLLDDLLEYSRVGRVDTQAREFRFGDVIDEVLALGLVPPTASLEVEGRDVAFHTPRAPLEKIVRNLVANAVKHADRSDVRITVRAEPRGERVDIVVSDDGPGIAPEYHARVFRMFQTLKPRDQVEASGVGLAIVKKAVEVHGGRVGIESDGRRGTTIRFDWPVRWSGSGEE